MRLDIPDEALLVRGQGRFMRTAAEFQAARCLKFITSKIGSRFEKEILKLFLLNVVSVGAKDAPRTTLFV